MRQSSAVDTVLRGLRDVALGDPGVGGEACDELITTLADRHRRWLPSHVQHSGGTNAELAPVHARAAEPPSYKPT